MLLNKCVGIVGAGIVGLLIAEKFHSRGWQVSVFEKDFMEESAHCSRVSAGMLAPCSELEKAEGLIGHLGKASLKLWDDIVKERMLTVSYRREGSLVLAHSCDDAELQHFKKRVDNFDLEASVYLDRSAIEQFNPNFPSTFQRGLFLSNEGSLDNEALMEELGKRLKESGVVFHYGSCVEKILPYTIKTSNDEHRFSWVIDCRGLGGKDSFDNLRGVRGEILKVHAPEVNFPIPIRFLHPRFPIYVVPREENHYLIGATLIESQSEKSITVRSILELLSAAYSLNPHFAEANIVETSVGLRPAFPDNIPKIFCEDGLVAVNGLYRHGFLLSPILAQGVADYCENKRVSLPETIFREASCV